MAKPFETDSWSWNLRVNGLSDLLQEKIERMAFEQRRTIREIVMQGLAEAFQLPESIDKREKGKGGRPKLPISQRARRRKPRGKVGAAMSAGGVERVIWMYKGERPCALCGKVSKLHKAWRKCPDQPKGGTDRFIPISAEALAAMGAVPERVGVVEKITRHVPTGETRWLGLPEGLGGVGGSGVKESEVMRPASPPRPVRARRGKDFGDIEIEVVGGVAWAEARSVDRKGGK